MQAINWPSLAWTMFMFIEHWPNIDHPEVTWKRCFTPTPTLSPTPPIWSGNRRWVGSGEKKYGISDCGWKVKMYAGPIIIIFAFSLLVAFLLCQVAFSFFLCQGAQSDLWYTCISRTDPAHWLRNVVRTLMNPCYSFFSLHFRSARWSIWGRSLPRWWRSR